MSIRFVWTRSQAAPEKTDDEPVEDGHPDLFAHPAPPAPGRVDADRAATANDSTGNDSTGSAVSPPSPEAVRAIWEVHARVLESERKTHRLFGAAAARFVFHETLLEERSALDRFDLRQHGPRLQMRQRIAPARGLELPDRMLHDLVVLGVEL